MEDQRGKSILDDDGAIDKFPIGMRVLAVDNDLTCLNMLEEMLRKCQYEVTTTDRATNALAILRENRDKFDLIITDVNMPDMDAFEFLQHVGLELDLPAIILSAQSDKELIMKGVAYGAFHYLVKPVRMEELRNIWQHVFRKKICFLDRGKGAPDDNARAIISNDTDQSANRTMIATEQGEDDDQAENSLENNDPSTQRKPRVVWCIDLHRNFVAAVKQLGIEKAVPKKILELMNVEGLTRENVASHLQKYRQYLKRVQSEEQAHMLAPLAARDSGWYARMASLDVYRRDFHSFSGPSVTSPPGGSIGRLNSPSALSYHGLGSSGLLIPGQTQSLSSSTNTLGRICLPVVFTNPSSNLPEGVPNSLKFNLLQQMNQGNTQVPHDLGTYGSVSSNWRAAADPLPQLPSNALPFGDPFLSGQPNLSDLHISSSSPSGGKSLVEFLPADPVSVLPEDSRRGRQCRDGLLDDVVQATTGMAKQSWEENKQDNHNSSLPFKTTNSMASSAGATLGSFGQYSQQPNAFCSNKSVASLTGELNEVTPSMQGSDAGAFSKDADMKKNDGFVPNDLEPVDDMMSMVGEGE